ncbi:hypothetical protein G7B40_025065 [Aetokthonos hydrillicola Thurmond2011]|jgi:hypothetical protein|uniref:Uncharacterized protein n=1 Tax=Aetokthonos hydrillicola Thurmond2011 TaxID=2712845 RepID=A0AAP5IDP1_9CYAN|nr:hypothetical protein [Aetokthonos hydrillicola CCALA 1050]MBW4586200.1 hypothetical protein [Aetokthonos hydrillicola CCALA 1050]MDR9897808.1 hypothetical protein [Aetokthonos hydrillicola Thurmond2011]
MQGKVTAILALTLLIHPCLTLKATAQTEQAAPCKDIPSCAVTGTVVIGGAIYYVSEVPTSSASSMM